MPRFLQQLLSPLDGESSTRGPSLAPAADDDIALGWECANPALQFESWEPAPVMAPVGAPGC